VIETLKLIRQGSLGPRKRKALALAVGQALLNMEKIAGKELLIDESTDDMKAVIQALRSKLGRAMRDKITSESPLARLAPQKRAMYEHLFELVYECSSNRTAAKALVDRILLKIT
jgi:hypothetical protein